MTNRRQGPKTGCLLRRTEDRAKTVSFETPNTVFTNLGNDSRASDETAEQVMSHSPERIAGSQLSEPI